MADDTERQLAEGPEQNAEMRAINERLVIAAVRQQELAGKAIKSAEIALKSGELYRLLAGNFPNGMVFLFDPDLRHIRADGRGLVALGLSKEALEGRTIWERLAPETCRQIEPAYRAALAGETTVSEVLFPAGTPLREKTERVYHRVLLRDRLDHVLAMSKRWDGIAALLFLDLDRFKQVNDTLAHDMGDPLLQHVAARLTGCLRAEDTVARMGGDEFVVLLPSLQAAGDAAGVAQKIAALLAAPILIEGHEMSVTASIGIGNFPFDGRDAASLMKRADAAMHQSKKGRPSGHLPYAESDAVGLTEATSVAR